ncbi:MAG: hypothetical protein NZ533_11730 [Casimicrobiaceae bacterium]|nr:hypothetical protein [Casimicrobiaceae bacterium]
MNFITLRSLLAVALLLAALLAAASAQAAGSPKRFKGYAVELPRETAPYAPETGDVVVAETAAHALIHQTGFVGPACATGQYLLIYKKRKTWREVDTGTCDDRGFTAQLKSDRLIFTLRGKPMAIYPLYE